MDDYSDSKQKNFKKVPTTVDKDKNKPNNKMMEQNLELTSKSSKNDLQTKKQLEVNSFSFDIAKGNLNQLGNPNTKKQINDVQKVPSNDSKNSRTHKLSIYDSDQNNNQNSRLSNNQRKSKKFEEDEVKQTDYSKNESHAKLTDASNLETEAFLIGREAEMKNLLKLKTNKDNKEKDQNSLGEIREVDSKFNKSFASSNVSKDSKLSLLSKQNSISVKDKTNNTFNNNDIKSKDYDEDKNINPDQGNSITDEPKFRYLKRKEKISDDDIEDDEDSDNNDNFCLILPEDEYKRFWDFFISM